MTLLYLLILPNFGRYYNYNISNKERNKMKKCEHHNIWVSSITYSNVHLTPPITLICKICIYICSHFDSKVSPDQNNIGRNSGYIFECAQCLLNMSAGLSFPFRNTNSTYFDTIASKHNETIIYYASYVI